MANYIYLLPVFTSFFAFRLCFSSCVAQDFNPRLPKLPKWNFDGLRKIPTSPELFKTTPEIIVMRGYPSEIHHVVTEDGYILELHRIPAKNANSRAVFLQHGAMQKSNEWVISASNRSLAFQLSDLGFDVWLGNIRGNSYCRNHTTLNSKDLEFWNFAWDEVGNYDIPAAIEYILKATGQPKLSYIGHSLGAAWFLIAVLNHPEIGNNIEMMIGLAPFASSVYYTPHYPNIQNNIEIVKFILRSLRLREVFDSSPITLQIINLFCGKFYSLVEKCRSLIMLATGPNPDNLDLESFPRLMSIFFSGTSVNIMLQFFQNYNKGFVFNSFDYGPEENMKRYGTETPKTYDLKKVTTPVHIFWGENDYIADPRDVEWLASNLGNLQTFHRVLNPKYNHLDFLFGIDVNEMVYQPLFSLLPPPN